ncbi:hypothetical protein EGW08_020232 [Elysia chlorotica]|uniref:Uncharacterized protein n=1 Tax=Elysia chlorotica TaxID=188477 RepID=A0A3S1ATX5_ELYCH|nr:hypothetical protein EGW08_020232 [Elysia chlorotica]
MAAHSDPGELQEAVTQRVMHVTECHVMADAEDLLRTCTRHMREMTLRLKTSDSGTCVVYNFRRKSLEDLKQMTELCRKEAENLESALLSHMEQNHPVLCRGRAAITDSGYCGSTPGSQVISGGVNGVNSGFIEPGSGHEQPATTHERPRAVYNTIDLVTAIQEQGDQSKC